MNKKPYTPPTMTEIPASEAAILREINRLGLPERDERRQRLLMAAWVQGLAAVEGRVARLTVELAQLKANALQAQEELRETAPGQKCHSGDETPSRASSARESTPGPEPCCGDMAFALHYGWVKAWQSPWGKHEGVLCMGKVGIRLCPWCGEEQA